MAKFIVINPKKRKTERFCRAALVNEIADIKNVTVISVGLAKNLNVLVCTHTLLLLHYP